MIFKLGFAKVHHSSGSDEQTRENVTITCTENNSKSPCIFYFPMQKVIIKYKAFIISNIIVFYFLLRDKLGTKSNA